VFRLLGAAHHALVTQVLELSNARKALSALLEQDSDGYTISAAIEHARRVGVDTEVCRNTAFAIQSQLLVLASFLAFNVAQVLNAASVIAQERAQKRLLIQNLKTGVWYVAEPFSAYVTLFKGLSADPARQRAILQPFVEEARSLGLSHDIVDAAQAKLKVAWLLEKETNA
jgi:hypothetical protein